MKINFNQDDKIPKDEIDVTVKASNFTNEVQELMKRLDELNSKFSVIPLSVMIVWLWFKLIKSLPLRFLRMN
ncbi:hypothetical protein [Companilactobacillus hulinensis]|uniref:hypothetical protein n=1 Tax=Companilactobacillus hulinensis TaxID=2486007 RepID=UPI000F78E176|nr:hypothetical protein [Companilactobacillus hulinensis]